MPVRLDFAEVSSTFARDTQVLLNDVAHILVGLKRSDHTYANL